MSALLLAVAVPGRPGSLRVTVRETPVPGVSAGPGPSCAHRVRVTLRGGGRGPVVDDHLRVGAQAPPPWPRLADVVVAAGTHAAAADGTAAAYPGAAVVAVARDAVRCRLRLGPYGGGYGDGYDSVLLGLHRRGPGAVSWAVWASLAHAWLVAGLPAAALASVTVRQLTGRERAVQSAASSSRRRSRSCTAAADSGRFTAV
ncbi:hypothetical protein [Streptomyces natalensis]|uniref:hypothetical protein n=1 Tax=Streptomyces natalensis TaxID=68242 RepID=UPI0018E37AAF|nr:hypothetical protein [Streptomyces natalensis]